MDDQNLYNIDSDLLEDSLILTHYFLGLEDERDNT